MYKLLLVIMFAVCFGGLSAAEPTARIDIDGRKSKIILQPLNKPTGGAIYNPKWIKDGNEGRTYLYVQGPKLKDDQWIEFEFSFIAKETGDVTLRLSAPYIKDTGEKSNYIWIDYKSITAIGTTIKNSNFNEVNESGSPISWKIIKKDQLNKENDISTLKVSYKYSAVQQINVTKNTEIIIKVIVKRAISDKS